MYRSKLKSFMVISSICAKFTESSVNNLWQMGQLVADKHVRYILMSEKVSEAISPLSSFSTVLCHCDCNLLFLFSIVFE